jgi:hypothetical protein
MMLKKIILALAVGGMTCMPTVLRAQQLIGSYVALLSEADHFNSQGQRLTSAAAIIRQDRANFHRFKIRDPEDQDDPLFGDERNRSALEQMLERGRADPAVISRIVNGTVLIRVDIYRSSSGPFIQATLLDKPQADHSVSSPPEAQKTTTIFGYSLLRGTKSSIDQRSRSEGMHRAHSSEISRPTFASGQHIGSR